MSKAKDLPLASKKQEYIDGLGNAHEWTNADTCVKGNLMFLDIVEIDPVTHLPTDSAWYESGWSLSTNANDGTQVKQLTPTSGVQWLPDGTYVYFEY